MFANGDKAIVRLDLADSEKEVWPEFVSEMEAYVGKEVTIVKLGYGRTVSIQEDSGRYAWLEDWLIPVEKFDAASSKELVDFLGI